MKSMKLRLQSFLPTEICAAATPMTSCRTAVKNSLNGVLRRSASLVAAAALLALSPWARASLEDCARAINASSDVVGDDRIRLGNVAVELCDSYAGEARAKAHHNRGTGYVMRERWVPAEEDFDIAIANFPKFSDSWASRAGVHAKLHHNDQCVYDYTKALELGASVPDQDYNGRGICYERLGKFDLALQDDTKAIELNPNDAHNWESRGRLYYEKFKDYDKALGDFNSAIQRDGSLYMAHVERGNIYVQRYEFEKGLADNEQVASLRPNDADSQSLYGTTAFIAEKYDLAAGALEKAIRLGSTKTSDVLNLGESYFHLGRYGDALREYDLAARSDPRSSEVYCAKAQAYEKLKRFDKFKEASAHCKSSR